MMDQDEGRSPLRGSGHQPPASAVPASQSGVPNAICGYPIAGWRLDHVQWDVRDGQPDGWIVSLHRLGPAWDHNRSFVVMARSDLGPLEAWDEALKIALREDVRERERRAASGIEAERADETRSGSAEGESPVGEAETPNAEPSS